jgi:hypothetical protein
MHMHAATGDDMRQNVLIRKVCFVVQYRLGVGLTDIFA